MKYTIAGLTQPSTIPMRDLSPGEIGIVTGAGYDAGTVVICDGFGEGPNRYQMIGKDNGWDSPNNVHVRRLIPGESITITAH